MMIAVRLRGRIAVASGINDTMSMLRLNRVNHAVLLKETPSNLGMLKKAKDYITWGEVDKELLEKTLSKRARLAGSRKVTEEYLSQNTKYKTFGEIADVISKGEEKLEALGIKPVIRLHPPRKGHEGIKRTFKEGGALGYRGPAINAFIERMI